MAAARVRVMVAMGLKAVREPVSRLQISYTIQNPSHRSKPEENLKKSNVKLCENA
jgi:hypothetical protein